MLIKCIKYILKFCIALILLSPLVTANAHIDLDNNTSSYTNFKVDYFVEKPDQNMDISKISNLSFDKQTSNAFSFGYTENIFWFHFSVTNNSDKTKNMILELTEVIHKTVDLYIVSTRITHMKNGLRIPVKEREIKASNPSFPLTFAPYENKEIYIKLSSIYGVFGAIQLKTTDTYKKEAHTMKYIYIFYFTVIFTIAFYNLIFFFYLRENIYLIYIGHIGLFVIWALNYKGILLPYSNIKVYDILQATIPFFFILLILFSQAILETKRLYPVFHKILNGFIIVCLISVAWMLISLHSGFTFMNIVAAPLLPFLFFIAFWALYKQQSNAKIYLIALSVYLVGMSLLSLLALGILPYSILLSHAAMIGSFFEVIFFSFLLAFRINSVRQESLKSQQELIAQQKTESTRLFHTVAEKTMALNRAKEQLEKELEKKEALEKHLKHLASTDPMTELLNRRAFFDICDKIIIRTNKIQQKLTCIVIDIDHFKPINDTYGHDMGDKVIKTVAKLMLENTRTVDHVGRIGGEEFAILMPNTDREAAYQISDRLRENIAKQKILLNNKYVSVTVSIGLSCLTQEDTNIHTLLKRADTALYKAKENGRNQVCSI